MLTPEHRYHQAVRKARIIAARNLRQFLRGEIQILPCTDERAALIAEIGRAYEAGADMARELGRRPA